MLCGVARDATTSEIYQLGRLRTLLSVSAVALVLASCTQFPRDAPAGDTVREGAIAKIDAPGERVPYALVKLSPSIVQTVNNDKQFSSEVLALAHLPSSRGTNAAVPIGIGDVLSITIFEAQSGGLFIPTDAGARAGNFVSLPNQQVDNSGFITVPYVGDVKIVGMTPKDASRFIADKLKSRAIEPQVVVATAERHGNEISVLGEVNAPTRFGLDPGGIRLSGAIARVGGPKFPDYDTAFTLERGGRSYRANLSAIFLDPKLDFQLQGNDVVYLSHDPRFVMVFGATLDPTLTSITRRVTFESNKMNLAEAIAKAGGLNTARADARSVFVFRKEPKAVLTELGLDTSRYTAEVPTVYSVNLSSADGFFLSDAFQLRNRDIIVVSEAPVADYTKFFTLLNQIAVVPNYAGTISINATR